MIYMLFVKFLKLSTSLPKRVKLFIYLRWNKIIFRLNKVQFGDNMRIYNRFYLKKNPSAIVEIGDNFKFSSGDAFNPLCRNIRGCIYAEKYSKIEIGNNVGISSACLWAKKYIKIGNNVKIGGDCILMDTDAHNLNYLIRSSNDVDKYGVSIDCSTAETKPIIIEDDVLIGTRTIILKGVTIGARSIIGSGSVVTKSIPADCIAAGNPAKVIRNINVKKDYE